MRLNENNSDTDYANKMKYALYLKLNENNADANDANKKKCVLCVILFLCVYFINLLHFIYFIRIGLNENNEDDPSFYLILIRRGK